MCLCLPSSINWYRPLAGKVTVGLASHWPCVTDSVVYPPTGSVAWERETSTPPKLHSEYCGVFTFTVLLCCLSGVLNLILLNTTNLVSTHYLRRLCRSAWVACLAPSVCLSVCLSQHNSKTNDTKCSNLVYGMILGYPKNDMVWTVSMSQVTVRVKATAILCKFEERSVVLYLI